MLNTPSINPIQVALNAAKKAIPTKPNTQQVFQSSLNQNNQQVQAPISNNTYKPPNIGGISSPFGAPNINSKPIIGGTTPISLKSSQPLKQLPKTGANKTVPQENDIREAISQLGTDIKAGATLQQVKESYPEFQDLDETVLSELGADINNGATLDEIIKAYPELNRTEETQQSTQQGGAKGQLAPSMIPQVKPILPTTAGGYNPLKTLANAPGSVANVGINITNMALNPIDTLKAIAKTAVGGVGLLGEEIGKKLFGKDEYKQSEEQILQQEGAVGDLYRAIKNSKEQAKVVTDYFKGYGDKEELQRRLEEDPAGIASDVLTLMGIGGTALAKAGQATKLGKVAQFGQKVAQLEKYDPYTYLPKQAKVLAKKPGAIGKIATPASLILNPVETYVNQGKNIIEGIKKAPAVTSDLYQGAKESYARKVVGLTENTVEAIKSNKYLSEAEGGKLTRDSLTQSAGTLLNKQIQDLSETGRGYSQIRDSGIPINVSSKKPAINKILSDNTIKVNGEGILDFTDSAIENKADQVQLQKVYDYFNRGEVTPDIYLNKKKAIRDMTDFSQGNADATNRILKQIGSERKQAGHESIPELKQLDAIYEPQITDINEIRNKIFDKDGKLREGATSYIMNSLGANRDVTLQKLEKLMPEISEQVKAIKAVEDINASKGIRPGTYNKTAAIIGGAKAGAEAGKAIGSYLGTAGEFIGGGIGGIVGAIGGIVATDPAYIINKLRGIDVKLPDEILEKIQAKQVLSTAQKNKVSEILSSLDSKKQQIILEQIRKDQKYPIKLKQEGLQTKGATLPKATLKVPPIIRESGNIGQPYKITPTAKTPTNTPSVSAPKAPPKKDTFARMTELDSNPLYKKLSGSEVLPGVKLRQGLYESPLGKITNTVIDGMVKKYTVNGKNYNLSDLGGIWEKLDEGVVKINQIKSNAISALKDIEKGNGKVIGSSLRSVLDELGIDKVDNIPEDAAEEVLKMVRARSQAPKGMPKLGKEILEELPNSPKNIKLEDGLGSVKAGDLGKGIRDNENVRKLQESISQTKEVSPIEIDKDGFIVDGEHRYKALINLGVKNIPVYVGKQLGVSGRLEKPYQGLRIKVSLPPLPKKGK